MRLLNIGYGNVVVADRVVAVISPESAPMKRLKDEARKAGRLIDGTQGRRTRSILITDSHHIVLSALQTETVAERLERGAPSNQTAHARAAAAAAAVAAVSDGDAAAESNEEASDASDEAADGGPAEEGDEGTEDEGAEEPGHE